MQRGKVIKLLGLNLGIALVNVILFSPGLVAISFGKGNVFERALAFTAMIMSVILFVFGNYKLIMGRAQKVVVQKLETVLDYMNALEQNRDKKVFAREMKILFEQIDKWEKKKVMVQDLLLQKFTSTEMSYSKFVNVIEQLEKVFYMNMKSILNKITIFDQEDYEELRKSNAKEKFSADFITAKMGIYHQYIDFVAEAIEDNEDILLKLDQLLLELSKFNSLEAGEIEEMSAMQEIDELIAKAKFYK